MWEPFTLLSSLETTTGIPDDTERVELMKEPKPFEGYLNGNKTKETSSSDGPMKVVLFHKAHPPHAAPPHHRSRCQSRQSPVARSIATHCRFLLRWSILYYNRKGLGRTTMLWGVSNYIYIIYIYILRINIIYFIEIISI